MVTLEQVEQLDQRVRKVVGLIESLRHENARLYAENRRLQEENQRLEYHLQESERRSLALTGAQELLEKGLIGAIDRLDSVAQDAPIDPESVAPIATTTHSSTEGELKLPLPAENAGVDPELSGLLSEPLADEIDMDEDMHQDEKPHGAAGNSTDERKMDIF